MNVGMLKNNISNTAMYNPSAFLMCHGRLSWACCGVSMNFFGSDWAIGIPATRPIVAAPKGTKKQTRKSLKLSAEFAAHISAQKAVFPRTSMMIRSSDARSCRTATESSIANNSDIPAAAESSFNCPSLERRWDFCHMMRRSANSEHGIGTPSTTGAPAPSTA